MAQGSRSRRRQCGRNTMDQSGGCTDHRQRQQAALDGVEQLLEIGIVNSLQVVKLEPFGLKLRGKLLIV